MKPLCGCSVIAGIVGLVCFYSVYCQPITSVSRDDIISNLTALVRHVVSPTAVPNENMINFAMETGLTPATTIDGLILFKMLKNIARHTPEVIKNFTNVVTNPDGSTGGDVDLMALTLYTLKKTKEYERLYPNGFNIVRNMDEKLPIITPRGSTMQMPDAILRRMHSVKQLIQRYVPNASNSQGQVTLDDLLSVRKNESLIQKLKSVLG